MHMASSPQVPRYLSVFEPLDRHTPSRSPIREANCTFRTSFDPDDLRSQERYARQRNHERDVFRSCSDSSSRPASNHRSLGNNTRITAPHYVPSFVRPEDATVSEQASNLPRGVRYVSQGNIWAVGGRAAAIPLPLRGVDNGIGEVTASGTTAPMLTAQFLDDNTKDKRMEAHAARVALALDIDQARRVLPLSPPTSPSSESGRGRRRSLDWKDNAWANEHTSTTTPRLRSQSRIRPEKAVPSVAFRVLDAPRLKDDFYCSVLAYYYPTRTLAVALTHKVYLWTEKRGVRYPPLPPARPANYVSSLAFSSIDGGKGILAVARNSGHVTLWSLFERSARFEAPHPWAACSVAFRPTTTSRQINSVADPVMCEDLLVGDDSGSLYYYSVYWPKFSAGTMILLTKLDAHSQNVCGLAWSPDGKTFVSGGNDNAALLFDVDAVLGPLMSATGLGGDEEQQSEIAKSGPVLSGLLTPPESPSRGLHFAQESVDLPNRGEHAAAADPNAVAVDIHTPPEIHVLEERQGRSRIRSP